MSSQEEKLEEAKHYLRKMEECYQSQNLQEFKFSLSAFLTAARSILQYTLKSAQQQGRQSDYDELVTGKAMMRYFKEERDINIHEKPVRAIASATSSIEVVLDVIAVDDPDYGKAHKDRPDIEAQENPVSTYTYNFNDGTDVLDSAKEYLSEIMTFLDGAQRKGLLQ